MTQPTPSELGDGYLNMLDLPDFCSLRMLISDNYASASILVEPSPDNSLISLELVLRLRS